MHKERIFITGMGAVTPVGIGVPAYWAGLIAGRSGIGDIPAEMEMPVKRAALVKDLNAREHLPMRLVQDLEPFMQYAYIAAMEALRESGLEAGGENVGVVMGTALGGVNETSETAAQYARSGKQASPKFLTKAMGNMTAAQFAIEHKLKGPSLTVSTACSSGGDAITTACLLLYAGMADAVIVMAGEAAICPSVAQCLMKAGALSKTGESRPFDIDRNGFVLGEGGGALVLESEANIRKRNAKPLAELLGFANSTDGFNPVSPDPSGKGAANCIQSALKRAGILPEQVDYVNAHGTATAAGDIAETNALHLTFGERPVFVSSIKGATGHMMGAGGITELIACVKAIQTGVLPPNIGFAQADPNCSLNIVTNENSRQRIHIAISNSLGFGGQNSCIVVGSV